LDGVTGPSFVAVTGLAFEARIVAGAGIVVVCAGGKIGLKRAIESSLRQGCRGILSFGISGGLAPHLKPGTCVVASSVICEHGRYPAHGDWAQSLLAMLRSAAETRIEGPAALREVSFADIVGSDTQLSCAEAKRALYRKTGAVAVDMESHVAARIAAEHRVPFAAFRVITDPADRGLPAAARMATRLEGTIDIAAVVRSVMRRPAQLPTLFRLALDSWAARRSLIPGRRCLGPNLGLPDLRERLLDVA
jgi:adenosylhomocysteine nucleosidase